VGGTADMQGGLNLYKLHIVPPTLRHLAYLCEHMRQEDIVECLMADRKNFFNTSIFSLVKIGTMVVVDDNNICLAIGGIHNGIVWLLCTDALKCHELSFVKFMREVLRGILKSTPRLFNKVWKGNKLHIKWLKWLGARMIKDDGDFIYFEFTKM
jgi:hypothetical protein